MVRLVTVSVQNDSGIGAAETTPAPVTPLYHPCLGCSQAMLARDGKDTQTTLRTDCQDLQKYTHRRHTGINSGPDKGFGSHRAVVEITPNEWEMCEGTTMGWGNLCGDFIYRPAISGQCTIFAPPMSMRNSEKGMLPVDL